MAEVSVQQIDKHFTTLKALDDVTMTFPDGGFFGLLGPSGSGKTTLLRIIAGFIFADRGVVRIGGESVERIPVEKREIGMVFQNYALFPNMSVADNVGFGLRVRGVSSALERKQVGEVLDLVQLEDLGQRRPHQLSGGQRQRVALARAIVTQPKVLLLDEPLSALDKALRVDMQIELKRIQREVGITTIFVTHDQEEALTLSDQIGILRDGRLIQSGAPREVYNAPVDVFTAKFLGEANIFGGKVETGGLRLADGSLIAVPGGAEGTEVIAIRPESIEVSSEPSKSADGNSVQAILRYKVFAGAIVTCIFEWRGQALKVVGRDQDLNHGVEGQSYWLGWSVEKTLAIRRS